MFASVLPGQPTLFTSQTAPVASPTPTPGPATTTAFSGINAGLASFLGTALDDVNRVRNLPGAIAAGALGQAGGGGAAAHQQWRRDILSEHLDWHVWQSQQRPVGSTYRPFFDYHRELLNRAQENRRANGLPPLQPMTPPASVGTINRPNPNDPRYRGNFNLFAQDMIAYHNAYHGSTRGSDQDISSVATAPLHDRFYEFHLWVEQQYQAWQANNR